MRHDVPQQVGSRLFVPRLALIVVPVPRHTHIHIHRSCSGAHASERSRGPGVASVARAVKSASEREQVRVVYIRCETTLERVQVVQRQQPKARDDNDEDAGEPERSAAAGPTRHDGTHG
jgi:hypothetical protein